MHYIVFDLEWNQRTGTKQKPEPGLPFEIIEIGAIKLDQAGRIVSRFSETIRPAVYLELSSYTEELTHVHMDELLTSSDAKEVYTSFLEWCGKDICFCSWGAYDLEVLQQNLAYFKIPVTFKRPLVYYDVQKLFSIQFQDGKDRKSLELAVEALSLPHGSDFHRALQDAYYTACVWQKLDPSMRRFFSVDYYELPSEKEGIWTFDFGSYVKYVGRPYMRKTSALTDHKMVINRCAKCHVPMEVLVPWFYANQKLSMSLCSCKIHGKYQLKLRVRQSHTGQYFAVKTMKEAMDGREEKIREKYAAFLKTEGLQQLRRKK